MLYRSFTSIISNFATTLADIVGYTFSITGVRSISRASFWSSLRIRLTSPKDACADASKDDESAAPADDDDDDDRCG